MAEENTPAQEPAAATGSLSPPPSVVSDEAQEPTPQLTELLESDILLGKSGVNLSIAVTVPCDFFLPSSL